MSEGVRQICAYIGRLALIFWQSLCSLPTLRLAEVAEEAYEVVGRSAFFVCVTMGFTGAILVMQAAGQAANVLGDTSPIGAAFLQLLVREFGPLVSALLVAARYGAGVAASIAARVVTEQVDALRLSGVQPVPFLVAPRVWGAMLGILPLVILATAVCWGAGAWVASSFYGIGLQTFASVQQVSFADVCLGLLKALLFGVAIPVVSAHAGLAAKSGAQAVGNATTRAVIDASVTLLCLDLLLSALGYAVLGQ
jgi:phospholipid/cholesterol/gamma-HCH transport system permease protein